MQILQIKPSTPLLFKPPTTLSETFTLSNLTLHQICIYIVPIHKDIIVVHPVSSIIQAFQQLQIQAIVHWNQQLQQSFRSKLRVYIWQNYQDLNIIEDIHKQMFNRETDGNCLMFEEINVHFQLDCNFMRYRVADVLEMLPCYYFVRRVQLPNLGKVSIDEKMHDRLFQHCQKLGKVKAIYTYEHQFVIQYINITQPISSFFQIRDNTDNMALFVIGCLSSYGRPLITPNIINLNPADIKQPKKTSIKQKNSSKKKLQQPSQQYKQFEHHHHHHNPKVSKVKQSFIVQPGTSPKKRRRNKSEESIRVPVFEQDQFEEVTQEQSAMFSIDWLKQCRKGQTYQTKINKQYQQSVLQLSKKVLNAAIGHFQGQSWIFLLFEDSVLVCDTTNITNKWKIKFQPIDHENIGLRTPMILTREQIIFGNQSYLYWISLKGNNSTWKYVQRKQIYCIQLIQQLNLLMVGGKNFSKLSYLGKSTSRSNLKVYSGGKNSKYDHLFTYDIPNCHGDNVIELKYITTKPTTTKLLALATNFGKIAFLRVRSYNEIQIYSQMHCHDIGIQEILSFNYCQQTGHLVCMERLDVNNVCFKFLKVNCSYEKVQISTESVKLPVTDYNEDGCLIGYDERYGNGWITACQKDGKILLIWVDTKITETIETNKNVLNCFVTTSGYIFQEKTSIRYKLLK